MTRSLRILRVAHRLYPPTLGGSAKYTHELSREQAAMGDRVVVFTCLEGKMPRHEWRDGYEIFRFSAPFRPLENPISTSMMRSLIRAGDGFDLLCAQSHLMFTTALVAMLNEYLHMPLVVTNHGFSVKRDPMFNFLESCYLNLIARRIFRRADYVFNFTQADRRHVISMGVSPNRAVVIPNGVDTDLFKPNTEAEDPHSILWVGRLVPEKGLEYLLGAMPEIINKIPQAKLRIVGYGDRTRLMSLISQLQLEPNVECLGVLEGKRLAHAINRCAVFVLPSLSEGLPTTLLEAMACAKPVVATEGIGLNEVLGQAGLYVSPRSESEIAKATVNLLRDRTLRLTLGRRARQTIEREHSWYRTAPILERFYQNAVS